MYCHFATVVISLKHHDDASLHCDACEVPQVFCSIRIAMKSIDFFSDSVINPILYFNYGIKTLDSACL